MLTTRKLRTGGKKSSQCLMFASGLCLVVSGMATGETFEWSYDGSYAPDSATPPTGQSTWTVVTTGDLAIEPNSPSPGEAFFFDNSTSGRIQMSNLLDETSLGFVPDPATLIWEFSLRAGVLSPGFPRVFIGVRDEGAPGGKFVMFSHASTGENLFYLTGNTGGVLGDDIYTGGVDGPNLADSLMHDYRMVKYDSAGAMMLDFYVDNTLMDTRPYADFNDATTTNLGFGVFTSTPGTSDYVIDQLSFTATAAPFVPILPTTERPTTDLFRYDGTYAPDSVSPPAEQSTWNIVATGTLTPATIQPNTPTAGVATLIDDDVAGRVQMSNALTDTELIATPLETEWEYRFDMAFDSMDETPPTAFGLRDEGGKGRAVMFVHNQDGDVYWTDPAAVSTDIAYEAGVDGPSLLDGQMHTYRVVKDVQPDVGVDILLYIDDTLIDTRSYGEFASDNTGTWPAETHGFGIYRSTPGLSAYVIDEVYFGVVTGGFLEADFDEDGDVDGDDFLRRQSGFPTASGAGKMDGDYDNDGDVDGDDFLGWQAEFPSPGDGAGAGAVPEPGSVALLCVCALTLLPRMIWRRDN